MELSFRCVSDGCENEVEFICSCSLIQSYCIDHLPNEQNHCSNAIVTKSLFESIYYKKKELAADALQNLIGSGKFLLNQIIGLINFYTKQIDSNSLGILDIKNLSSIHPTEEQKKNFIKAAKKCLKVYKNEKPEVKEPKSYIDGSCKKCILLKNEKNHIISNNYLNETRLKKKILKLESYIDQLKKEIKIKESIIEQNKYQSIEEIGILKNKINLLSSALNIYKAHSNYIQKLTNELNNQQSHVNQKESKILKIHEELIKIHRNILKDRESNETVISKNIIEDLEKKIDKLSKNFIEVQNDKQQIEMKKKYIDEIEENKLKEMSEIQREYSVNSIKNPRLDPEPQTPQGIEEEEKEEEEEINQDVSNEFVLNQDLKTKIKRKRFKDENYKNYINKTERTYSTSINESPESTKTTLSDLKNENFISKKLDKKSLVSDKSDSKEESKSKPSLKRIKGSHKKYFSQADSAEILSLKNTPHQKSVKNLPKLKNYQVINNKLHQIDEKDEKNEKNEYSPSTTIYNYKKSPMLYYSSQNLVLFQSEDFRLFEQNNLEGKKKILKTYMKENFDLERLGSKITEIRKSTNDEYFAICKGYVGSFYEDCYL